MVDEVSPSLRFLDALARFESAASFYAPEHVRVDDAHRALAVELTALAGAQATVTLARDRAGLTVQSQRVEGRSVHAARALADFDALSVLALEFDVNCGRDDLHAFARRWRAAVQQASSSRNLQSAAFDDLPAGVRVRLREFGRRVSRLVSLEGHEGGTDQEPGDSPSEESQAQSASEAARARRDPTPAEFVTRTVQRIAQSVVRQDPRTKTVLAAQAGRGLEDVLALAGDVLQHAVEHYLSSASGFDDLDKLFQSIEQATALSTDSESARLLVDVMQSAARDVLADQEAEGNAQELALEATVDEGLTMSIDELREAVTRCRGAGGSFADLEREDRCEVVSIAVASMVSASADEAAATAQALRERVGRRPLSSAERELIATAVVDLAAQADAASIDRILPEMLRAVPETESGLLAKAYAIAARDSAASARETLWPHVVIEVLREGRSFAQELARGFDCGDPQAATRRLSRLLQSRQLEPQRATFRPLHASLAPLYAALAGGPTAERAAALCMASLRENAAEVPAARLLVLLADSGTACANLLSAALTSSDDQARAAIELRAVRALARQLTALPATRCGEPWVLPALEALADCGTLDAAPAFERVLSERRWWIRPIWSAECRAAARRWTERTRSGNAGASPASSKGVPES